MSAEPKQTFRAVVDAYEAWRDKRGLTRHAMGWTSSVQDELEQRGRGRR